MPDVADRASLPVETREFRPSVCGCSCRSLLLFVTQRAREGQRCTPTYVLLPSDLATPIKASGVQTGWCRRTIASATRQPSSLGLQRTDYHAARICGLISLRGPHGLAELSGIDGAHVVHAALQAAAFQRAGELVVDVAALVLCELLKRIRLPSTYPRMSPVRKAPLCVPLIRCRPAR